MKPSGFDPACSRFDLTDVSLTLPRSGSKEILVLDHISLKIAPGQVITLLGTSGAGKTSLLKLIAGRIPPSSGSIQRQPVDRNDLSRREAANHLYLPGESRIDPRAGLIENLIASLDTDLPQAHALITALGLAPLLPEPISTWPQMAQYRAEIVWAFSRLDPILLIDEIPGLDEQMAAGIAGLVRDRAASSGQSVIVATCGANVARTLGNRIIVLNRGRIALDRAVDEIDPPGFPVAYSIQLRGAIDPIRAAWFDATRWDVRDGVTIMTVGVKDQAGLHGLLTRIRDLALEIDSLQRCSPLDEAISA